MNIPPAPTLQPHQERIRSQAADAAATGEPFKKLLLWGTGAGKGGGAFSAIGALGAPATVVGPAALRPTLRAESQKFLGNNNTPVHSYQSAATGKATPTPTLAVDEVQRLTSPSSTQAAAVSQMANQAKNVILMSGTPIRNRPSEFAPLMSILTGNKITPEQFDQRYVGTVRERPGGALGWLRGVPAVEKPSLVNTEELKHLLDGKIDYHFPETPPVGVTHETHEAEMTPRQAELYSGMFGKLPLLMRWKMRFNYPLSDDELVRARSFMTGPRQVALSDLPYRSDGDPYRAFLNSGKLTKAHELLRKTLDSDSRTRAIVYSNFPEAGLRPYAAALARDGVGHAVFDGKLSDAARKTLVDDFNSGKTRVAFVGPAGAEGISLKGAQLTQILDGHWANARTQQAIGRGVRYDSHTGLPEELKKMTIQKFVAKLPLGVRDRLMESVGFDRSRQRTAVDDYLSNLADRKEVLNKQLMQLLKEVGTPHQKVAAVTDDLNGVLSSDELARLTTIAYSAFPKLAAKRPTRADAKDPADVEDCPSCGASMERGDDGYCNSCLAPRPAKSAAEVDPFREAKRMSDLGTPDGYAKKTDILRALIRTDPKSWYVDSVGQGVAGITHASGWRYHLPLRNMTGLPIAGYQLGAPRPQPASDQTSPT